MKQLNKLYDLRSRIVHSEPVDQAELTEALPFASQALRQVWRWYFNHFPNAKDNKLGITRIDEELLGS